MKATLVVFLGIAWVLLTSHCRIEALTGFEFLRCGPEAHSTEHAADTGDPCQDSGCCSVESAQYHPPRQHELMPLLVMPVVPEERFDLLAVLLPSQADGAPVIV